MLITKFLVKCNKENVLSSIDCFEDSPIFEQVAEEFDAIEETAYEMIKPYALFEIGEITENIASELIPAGTKALYLIMTVGAMISEWSNELFHEGNYLAGLLANSMADDYLFQIDDFVKGVIQKECQNRNLGILKRLEAPLDIAIEAQRAVWEITKAKEVLGINMNASYMYDPVKSMSHIFLLEEGLDEYHIDHDCSKCMAFQCHKKNK
ncbi:MAG: hypothetical protein K0S76_2545 [Herbinix sp.]|jgi:hypothetical protein|nr:hypothetical protein [Herbinix sp.]